MFWFFIIVLLGTLALAHAFYSSNAFEWLDHLEDRLMELLFGN